MAFKYINIKKYPALPLKLFLCTLLLIVLFTAQTTAQKIYNTSNITGKTFISKTLEYLSIISDSTLCSSINNYSDTAAFSLANDSLIIKQQYGFIDKNGFGHNVKYYGYKIIALNIDTVWLQGNQTVNMAATSFDGRLLFINIDKLKEPIAGFTYLKIDCSNAWTGNKHITIDAEGKVVLSIKTFIKNHLSKIDSSIAPIKINGQLTVDEFNNFKVLLSRSLLSKLPVKRGCPINGRIANFEIVVGPKKYTSTGCNLSYVHELLFDYLYSLDINKGLIQK